MKELICIVCPNSCHMTIDENHEVSGNLCKRGVVFAQQEISHPQRNLCTTMKTIFVEHPVVAVKTDKEVDKNKLFLIMKEINKTPITKRLGMGEVAIENILNTGVNVILTTNDLKEQ